MKTTFVLALDNSTRLGVPDTELVALVLAEAVHHSFPRCVTELVGVLDMDKRLRADGSEVRKVVIFAVKHLIRCCHLERRMRDTIAQIGRRHHELSPHKRRESTVNEYAADHSAQRPLDAFGYTDLLWCVGRSEFLSYACS